MYIAFCKFTWHPSAPWAFIATLENNENDRVCELTFPKPDFELDDTAKAGSLIASSDPTMWDSLTADELAALQKGARRATDQLNRVGEIENYNRRKLIFITIAFAALCSIVCLFAPSVIDTDYRILFIVPVACAVGCCMLTLAFQKYDNKLCDYAGKKLFCRCVETAATIKLHEREIVSRAKEVPATPSPSTQLPIRDPASLLPQQDQESDNEKSNVFQHTGQCSDCPLWRSDARQQCEKIIGEAQKWLDYLDEHEDAQHTKAK